MQVGDTISRGAAGLAVIKQINPASVIVTTEQGRDIRIELKLAKKAVFVK